MTAPAVVVHRYHPRGAAATLLHHRGPEVLLSGPAGTGKSRACLEKLHLMALLNPGMRGLMIRKTAVSLTSTGLVTFREHVAAADIAAGTLKWYGGSQQESAAYRYTNGSIITIGGMDRATRVMSSEYDAIYVQEAIELTETDWEALTTRLRNGRISFQQLIADTNPDTPTHWLKQRVDRGTTVMLESRHEDNPRLYNADGTLTVQGAAYMAKLDALTGVRHGRLRKGLWVAAEGLVYEDFDPAVHVIDRDQLPAGWEDWARWWSTDFGFTNPMVIQQWAEDPDGRIYLVREHYRTKRTVDDHARRVLASCSDPDPDAPDSLRARRWHVRKPQANVCDHDAEGRVVLARETGIATRAAKKKPRDAGFQAVQRRLKIAADGKPRIFFVRDARVDPDPDLVEAKLPTSTVEEIVGYVWARNSDGTYRDEPVKENDHGMDAMRYLCAELDKGRATFRAF